MEIEFYETSAKNGTQVDEAVRGLISKILVNPKLQEQIRFENHL